ncbi:MAG: hypothetical protein N2578_08120 [Bdellovibrionaceae bacterium]|nr:hypothetical protein [Pseudobdellovibrionaceae bacterium]
MRVVTIIILLLSCAALGHPVSFKGGWEIQSLNRANKFNQTDLTHSLESNFAIGLSWLQIQQTQSLLGRLNWLVHRWNNQSSQANLYLSVGQGVEKSLNKESGVSLGALEADWESRHYYTSMKYLSKFHNDMPHANLEHLTARIGFAPYLAEFDEMSTWYILQGEKLSGEQLEVSQVLRFYHRNVLWEVGVSFQGNLLFNFMLHM